MFYRNNWYLEAWCHEKNNLRGFSVDAFKALEVLHQKAIEISESELNAEFNSSYGIYGGKSQEIALLRFSPNSARWVSDEQWHPEQIGQFDADGFYLLNVPYSHPTELVMDILRHGHHVEVIKPEVLRKMVKAELQHALKNYNR